MLIGVSKVYFLVNFLALSTFRYSAVSFALNLSDLDSLKKGDAFARRSDFSAMLLAEYRMLEMLV